MLVDTREKNRVLFPAQMQWGDHRGWRKIFRVQTEAATLKTGDYMMQGYAGCCVERKGSLSELNSNVNSKDAARFLRCLKRLSGVSHPYILLDFPLNQLQRNEYVRDGALVMDRLYRTMQQHGIGLLWVPATSTKNRTMLGEQIARICWNHYWEDAHQKGDTDGCSNQAG